MRPSRAGFLFLLLTAIVVLTAFAGTFARAQTPAGVTGEIESIGFANQYRPDAHTPMIVRINPGGIGTGLYQIQVHQKDLDGDDVIYYRDISITGGESGREQRYWMDFLPNPTELPDYNRGEQIRDLQNELPVYLTTTGGKELSLLKVTSTITSLDPKPSSFMNQRRGQKLILCVTDGTHQPQWDEFRDTSNLYGVLEDVTMVTLRVSDLPENPVLYDAVDAVIWFGADPAELKRGGDARYRSLESWIRAGGQLVICQTPEWQKFLDFGNLLPVTIQGVQQRDVCEPLRTLANSTGPKYFDIPQLNPKTGEKEVKRVRVDDPWEALKGPYTMARATAKPGTLIDEWITWDDKGKDQTPYIVREPYGIGAVTWVAQDLGDPGLARGSSGATNGWVYVWNKVFDWKNEPVVAKTWTSDDTKRMWARAGGVDMGKALVQGMEIPSKAGLFIATAVAFFLVYWGVAGPGFYVYLIQKRRASLSWFMFGLSALVATALTVLVVKLVLRGPPELHHTTFVTAATADRYAVVRSRFGLYIPRDGDQRIQLQNTSADAVSTINAFAIHPAHLTADAEVPSPAEYKVPIRDLSSTTPPAITVPYRSTLKKFESTWIGPISGRVEGSVKAPPASVPEGKLTNATGQRLENVYIAYKFQSEPGAPSQDWIIYLPSWEPGVTLDLAKEQSGIATLTPDGDNVPGAGKKLIGNMMNWQNYWNRAIKRAGSNLGEGFIGDLTDRSPRSIPVMTFFDRLSPIKNERGSGDTDRVEMLRRSGRHLDRSVALAAGSMVVLAEAPGPLPFPMTVEGDPVTGDGLNFYQFVIPIDRTPPEDQSTAATTTPAQDNQSGVK